MKNKKGSKQQKYIAQTEKQVKSGGDPKARRIEEERRAEKAKKEEAKKKMEEEKRMMSQPVVTQKLGAGRKSESWEWISANSKFQQILLQKFQEFYL